MDLELSGKRAIVTGASKGIGKAVARALVAEGVAVAIAARTPGPLKDAADELAADGGTVVPIEADTGRDDSVRDLVAAAAERLGGIDILVNSAARPSGQAAPAKVLEVDDQIFYDDVNVKVLGYLRCIREAAPHMVEQGWGRIVNISGLGARQTGSVMTSMRNVAVAALTKNAADELGRHGVNVTCVHPGVVRTEATPGVLQARAAATGRTAAEIEQAMGAATALGRIVDADEVAAVVCFLASPRSVAINGDVIACGGGSRGSIHY